MYFDICQKKKFFKASLIWEGKRTGKILNHYTTFNFTIQRCQICKLNKMHN